MRRDQSQRLVRKTGTLLPICEAAAITNIVVALIAGNRETI
jgi:hypothetical protein